MNIVSRLASTDDRVVIWNLYKSEMRHHVESTWGWNEDWQLNDFDKAFSNFLTYVVEAESKLFGYFQLDIKGGELYLRMMVLAPHARSKGIGAKLLSNIAQLSQQAGYALHFRVLRVNDAARRFYEREGWWVKAEYDVCFLMTHSINEKTSSYNPTYELHVADFEMLIEIVQLKKLEQ